MFKKSLVAVAFAVSSFAGTTAHAAVVDTVLSLVIDVSGSIDINEYNLQMDGYAAAFKDTAIQNGILDTGDGDVGKIAVNVVQFGTTSHNPVGFTVLDSVNAINAFADVLDNLARAESGSTNIAAGITRATSTIGTWLGTTGNSASRAVIDVSGDGTHNTGSTSQVTSARDAACGGNIDAINGITVGGGSSLLNFYSDNVICGGSAFAIGASDFDQFARAIKVKLNAEITGTNPIPVPAALPLLVGGLAVFGFVGRRRRAAA